MKEGARGVDVASVPIPAPTKCDVRRTRLLSRLTAALDDVGTLTLVGAPAGSGKTRLLAQWAWALRDDQGAEVVWVTLQRGEADLALVRSGLERIDDAALRIAVAEVSPEHSVTAARALARALSAAEHRIVIVIDDVHRIESEDAADMLAAFVQAVPDNVHVVLSGRGTRMIPLARMRVTGIALELDGSDLAFTPGEVRTLFAARGIHLSHGDIRDVLQRTEGWATGLRLMATVDHDGDRLIGARPLRGDSPEMVDYFQEEVLDDLDPVLQMFLEATAVPAAFSLSLAVALADGAPAAALIDRLLRLNVLDGSADAEPTWYHYHPLLRCYLLGRLRDREPARWVRIEGRAAAWFAREQDHLQALQHATRSGSAPCVATILRRSGMQLILGGYADDVFAATTQIPVARRTEPAMRMLTAAAELWRGDASVAASILPLPPDVEESDTDRRWRAGLDLHTAVRRGGIGETLDRLDDELRMFSGEAQLDTYAFLQAAMGELYIGRLQRAEEFARFAADLARTSGTEAAELQAEAVLTTSLLFRGRHRDMLEAGALLDQRWRELGEPDNTFFEVTRVWRSWVPYEAMRAVDVEGGLHAAARVIDAGAEPAIARGLHGMIELLGAETSTDPHETALSLLDHLSPRDDRPLPVHWYAMMSTFAVHAFDRLGEQTLRDRFIATLEGALGEAGEVHLARAIAAVHDHRPAAAKAALGPLLEGAAPCLFSASMIDAWLVAAEIDVHHGNPDRAQHALATALALAEPEEHVRRVAAAGPIVSRLLAARATAGSRTRFADTVRDRLATAGVLVEEPLTQRERIVLAALSRNATLREIATQEYISPNTVKTHVRNIYRKLGVSDREGVTAAAHALGIR